MNKAELIYTFIKALKMENQFPNIFCYLKNGEMGIIKDCVIYGNYSEYVGTNHMKTSSENDKKIYFLSRKNYAEYTLTQNDSLSIVKFINKSDQFKSEGDYTNFEFKNDD